MAIFEGLLGLGIALLLAPAIAEYAKIRNKAERGFNWLAVSGVFFLFAGTFDAPVASVWLGAIAPLGWVFQVLGWIVALIAAIFVAYEALLER